VDHSPRGEILELRHDPTRIGPITQALSASEGVAWRARGGHRMQAGRAGPQVPGVGTWKT